MPITIASFLVVAIVGVLDLVTRLGFAHGTWYLVALALAGLSRSPRLIAAVGAACIILTVVGFFASPPAVAGFPARLVLLNRFGSIVAIVLVSAFLVMTIRHRSRATLAEANAAAELAKATALAAGIQSPLFILDAQGQVIYENEEAETLAERAALVDNGLSPTDRFALLLPDLVDELASGKGGLRRRSMRSVLELSGTKQPFDVTVVPWSGGSTVTLQDATFGITRSERSRLLETVTDRLGAAISISLFQGSAVKAPAIVFANASLLEATGWSALTVGEHLPWERYGDRFICTDGSTPREIFEAAMRNLELRRVELRTIEGAQSPQWLELDLLALPGEQEDWFHLIALERDITQRRILESAAETSLRLQAMGRITGEVAHDFSNALMLLEAGVNELQESPLTGQRLTAAQQSITTAAGMGRDLVRRLKAAAGQSDMLAERIDIVSLLDDVKRAVGPSFRGAHRLSVTASETGLIVETDRAQLLSALTNLVINAIAALGPGGSVEIRCEGRAVAGGLRAVGGAIVTEGTYVALSVSDDGAGIPESLQERVFEPFFTTRSDAGGTGLGLSSVLGFAQQSGGYMTLASTEGEGTDVTILLPSVTRAAPCKESSRATREATTAGAVKDSNKGSVKGAMQRSNAARPPVDVDPVVRALLVDDDVLVLAAVQAQLLALGLDVTAVSSGEEACSRFTAAPAQFDVLVSDVTMPGMSGLQLVETCRRTAPGLSVLLITGYTVDSAGLNTLADNERTVLLEKPLTLDALRRALASLGVEAT